MAEVPYIKAEALVRDSLIEGFNMGIDAVVESLRRVAAKHISMDDQRSATLCLALAKAFEQELKQ